jgi:hypothetical protein
MQVLFLVVQSFLGLALKHQSPVYDVLLTGLRNIFLLFKLLLFSLQCDRSNLSFKLLDGGLDVIWKRLIVGERIYLLRLLQTVSAADVRGLF